VTHQTAGARFEFGENWRSFLETLNEERIAGSVTALADMLETETLAGKSFLDIGSGSGLSSLAALRLGASRVESFDYDPVSVACTREVRRRFAPGDERWTIAQGDATDASYLRSLGTFDVVYSWGVLHHTGAMWRALANAAGAAAPGGRVFVALYNDQDWRSRAWRATKRAYVSVPAARMPIALLAGAILEAKPLLSLTLRGRPQDYLRLWRRPRGRGMSRRHDLLDWIGGYPFEVARPEEVFDFFRARDFRLDRLRTRGTGHGCNEYVFTRSAGERAASAASYVDAGGREPNEQSRIRR
jgi:2-polyprenyl-6-hydroxyphenyl methylase/3-demethylubiquinone-9 3-methyltransferase